MGAKPTRKIPVKRKPPIKKSLKAASNSRAKAKNMASDAKIAEALVSMAASKTETDAKIAEALASMAASKTETETKIAASDAKIAEALASMAASKTETETKIAASDAKIAASDAKIAEALASMAASKTETETKIAASDAKIAEALASMAASKTETETKIAEALARMAASKEETDAKIAASDIKIAESNARLAASFDRLDRVVEETKAQLAGLSDSAGRAVESLAYSFFDSRMTFAGVKFDSMEAGLTRRKKLFDGTKIEGEYDLILYNGSAIALIEAKNRVRRGDVTKLINEQLPRFKLFFPQYKDFTFYLGFCGMSFDEGVEKEALEKGIGTLKPNGDAVEINEATVKAW